MDYVKPFKVEEGSILFFPICSEDHWHLLKFDFTKKEICHYSSFLHGSYYNSAKKVIIGLTRWGAASKEIRQRISSTNSVRHNKPTSVLYI